MSVSSAATKSVKLPSSALSKKAVMMHGAGFQILQFIAMPSAPYDCLQAMNAQPHEHLPELFYQINVSDILMNNSSPESRTWTVMSVASLNNFSYSN